VNVGYVDAGPADGPPVVLLHGWPYDIHSYVEVVPLLTAAGHRVIVPYLCGFGSTRFLSDETFRNGEQGALALDVVIHNYRWRLTLADGERQYDELEARLFEGPVITVPTITIGSDFDGAGADGHAYGQRFSGPYSHRVLDGIGHNVPQEAPEAFADAIVDVGRGQLAE
jgi:pimeloyl-ACP methyl ester carboxylesterase